MEDFISLYFQYQGELWTFVLGLVVFGLMFGLKFPIKKLTEKLTSEKYRKLANKSIIVLTLGFGILAQYIYSVIANVSFDTSIGLKVGTVAITAYAAIEGMTNKNTQKEIKKDGSEIIEKVADILEDGEITKEEVQDIGKSAVEKLKDIIGK